MELSIELVVTNNVFLCEQHAVSFCLRKNDTVSPWYYSVYLNILIVSHLTDYTPKIIIIYENLFSIGLKRDLLMIVQ